jgi:hypothetical protein
MNQTAEVQLAFYTIVRDASQNEIGLALHRFLIRKAADIEDMTRLLAEFTNLLAETVAEVKSAGTLQ